MRNKTLLRIIKWLEKPKNRKLILFPPIIFWFIILIIGHFSSSYNIILIPYLNLLGFVFSCMIIISQFFIIWSDMKRQSIFNKNNYPNYNDDKEKIENLINKCIQIKNDNSIYYITNDNITRLLKINKLLNNNEDINIDIDKIKKDDVFLIINLKNKKLYINYDKTRPEKYRYKDYMLDYNYYIDNILFDIFKFKKKYKTEIYGLYHILKEYNHLKPKNITINAMDLT